MEVRDCTQAIYIYIYIYIYNHICVHCMVTFLFVVFFSLTSIGGDDTLETVTTLPSKSLSRFSVAFMMCITH